MPTIILIVMLFLPGQAPMVDKNEVATITECNDRIAVMQANVLARDDQDFKFVAACEITMTKANKA